MESFDVTSMQDKEADIEKENLSAFDIKGEKNTLSTSEKTENSFDGHLCMYECGKHLLHSMYEHICATHETTISKIKEIMEIFKYDIKDICSTNWDKQKLYW